MVVVGGLGSIPGAFLAALLIVRVDFIDFAFPYVQVVVFAIAAVIVGLIAATYSVSVFDAAGTLLDKIKHAQVMGITTQGVDLDVEKLVEWKTGIVGKLTGGVHGLLKNYGSKVVMGAAKIVDKNTVQVTGGDGDQTIKCDDIVIATGSEPINIPGFTCDEDNVWSSTGALTPKEIPGHLLVIGGGVTGAGVALDAASRGLRTALVERDDFASGTSSIIRLMAISRWI